MPNLKELHLYFNHFSEWQKLESLEVPHTLKQLQLILGEYQTWTSHTNFTATKEFLRLFRDHLRSLTSIIIEGAQEFSNSKKLQSLVKDFTRLEIFQYYIDTTYQLDSLFSNFEQLTDNSNYIIYTLPKLNPFETPFKLGYFHSSFGSNLSMHVLFNCSELWISTDIHGHPPVSPAFTLKNDLKLVYLHSIVFNYPIEEMTLDVCQYISPNLTRLKIQSGKDAKSLIEDLYSVVSLKQLKQITAFQIWLEYTGENDLYHPTFFFDLSKIMMNLQFIEISIQPKAMNVCLTSRDKLIQNLRKHFRKLTYLKVSTCLSTNEEQEAVNRYKNHLVEIGQQTGSWLPYTVQTKKENVLKYRSLKIWL
jgi:hypothetical protein